ncbi:MAG TPA: FMN-binding negative transcriptional regulator [Bradyrhizobium sp.]
MYIPTQFREHDVPTIHTAIRQAGLATLVTSGPDGLIATPLPLLLDPEPGPYGTLHGHVAKANPQWQRSAGDSEALAMFIGPDAYISPSWYATKRETGKVVPTWNYVAIHAYGRAEFYSDSERLLALVTRLTNRHEDARAAPWAVNDAPPDFIQSQLKGIVGVELRITRLEGKWKMSQNRVAADREGVVEGLRVEGGLTVADLVACKRD